MVDWTNHSPRYRCPKRKIATPRPILYVTLSIRAKHLMYCNHQPQHWATQHSGAVLPIDRQNFASKESGQQREMNPQEVKYVWNRLDYLGPLMILENHFRRCRPNCQTPDLWTVLAYLGDAWIELYRRFQVETHQPVYGDRRQLRWTISCKKVSATWEITRPLHRFQWRQTSLITALILDVDGWVICYWLACTVPYPISNISAVVALCYLSLSLSLSSISWFDDLWFLKSILDSLWRWACFQQTIIEMIESALFYSYPSLKFIKYMRRMEHRSDHEPHMRPNIWCFMAV